MTKPLHRLAIVVAAAYLLVVALMVFWPTPVDRPAAGQLGAAIEWLHGHGLPTFIDYAVVEFSANVLMFVPMGFFASLFFKKARAGIMLGALCSCLIELMQALVLPERFASGLDILANSIGTGLGALLYFISMLCWSRFIHTSTLNGPTRSWPIKPGAQD